MRPTRLALIFPLLFALTVALAACGGDDAPSDEEYFQRMDEIDKETDEEFENITCDETSTAQDCATGFGEGVSSAHSKYEGVTPSEDAKDEHEELVAAIGELNDNIEGAEFQEDDPADAFFEFFDTARVDEAFCAVQALADEKQIEADVGCEGGGDEAVDPSTLPAEATTEVSIQDFAFDPPHIEVSVGDTVTWTQGADPEPHTATSTDDPAAFDTGTLTDEGETGEFTFTEAGVFPYYCEVHPEMLGQVTVTE